MDSKTKHRDEPGSTWLSLTDKDGAPIGVYYRICAPEPDVVEIAFGDMQQGSDLPPAVIQFPASIVPPLLTALMKASRVALGVDES